MGAVANPAVKAIESEPMVAKTSMSFGAWRCAALARLSFAGLVLPLVLAGQVAAQAPAPSAPAATPPAAAAAVSQVPERTTATFGDWTLRCERPATPVNAQRVCEIAQAIQVQGQQGPVAQLAIGRVQKSDPLKLTIVLPNNVTLTAAPKIAAEDKDGQLVDAVWQRCVPGGCFADVALRDDMLRRLRARIEPGRIEFRDAAGQQLRLPFSNRGLAQALDALAKE
ncbi:MAG TPA: invasion associated locus B family protein [Accumulibacter sp.]|nr:invasion associated locus B family protein [Accumulibacter sp.]